ncbi:MAG: hypothetical protein ACI9G1_004066 [Pirellulaceae bacterium]|jgi:hypothetical protein
MVARCQSLFALCFFTRVTSLSSFLFGAFLVAVFSVSSLLIPAVTANAEDDNEPPNKTQLDKTQLEFFESKIRPVLVSKCYSCHSEKAQADNKLKGGLLLDTRASMHSGGETGPAVVPGNAKESLIISALKHEDFEMPPQGKLPDAVVADFVKWVEAGAIDPREGDPAIVREEIDFDAAAKFWSFQTPQLSPLPNVKNGNWPKTDIDRYVLSVMEANELSPTAAAHKRVLIRRATFDLTGLPPTPEEVSAFLADDSTQAFENLIDRLLESPRYGERWGRHWLDVARYAEDQAHTFGVSKRVHAYQYRDWVIQAFNKDMPYDRFVKLQIAGDLLLDESADQFERIAGLGFSGLGAIYYKNSDKAKAIADELDDRIDTLTRGFLGLTVSCARCHDHKFDPIPTEDYYSLAGIFASTQMADRPLAAQELLQVYNAAQAKIREHDGLLKKFRIAEKERIAESHRNDVKKYMVASWMYRNRKKADNKHSTTIHATESQLEKSWLDRWDKYLDPKNKALEKVVALDAWRKLPVPDGKNHTEAPPAEVLAAAEQFQQHLNDVLDERDGKNRPQPQSAKYTSPILKGKNRVVDIDVDIKGAKELFLVVSDTGDDINNDWASWLNPVISGPAGEKKLNELKWRSGTTGWQSIQIDKNADGQPLKIGETKYVGIGTHATSIICFDLPGEYDRFRAKGYLDGSGTGSIQFRVYLAEPKDIVVGTSAKLVKEKLEVIKTVFSHSGLFSLGDGDLAKHLVKPKQDELASLEKELQSAKGASPPAPAMAHAIRDSGSKDLKVYLRGNPAKQGDVAPRRFLRILAGGERATYTDGSGRLQLAEEIASAENPLTARVIVNRVWQHHFGNGIVATSSNFGVLGEPPTHPELLDWLTVNFVKSGWSLKWLHKEVMRSAVYQLSSDHNSQNYQRDPENRYLWKMTRRRLDVESWRDALLSVSGNLDLKIGGPTMSLSDNNNNRRTVYASISRHELDGLLRLFDFPDANVTSAARSETTIPQQQLFVLNSEFFIRQAKSLAARLQKVSDDDSERIKHGYALLFGREPDAAELSLGVSFVSSEKPKDDKLSMWEQYTQALLGANEFMYID